METGYGYCDKQGYGFIQKYKSNWNKKFQMQEEGEKNRFQTLQ